MDPDPLRLLETAHPLRSRSISQGPPRSPFTIRPNCRLKRPSKLVNKTGNKFIKFVDGPTQMSRSRSGGLEAGLPGCKRDECRKQAAEGSLGLPEKRTRTK